MENHSLTLQTASPAPTDITYILKFPGRFHASELCECLCHLWLVSSEERVVLPCRKSWLWIVFLTPTDVWVIFVSTHWLKTHKGTFGRSVRRHARLRSRCGRDEAEMKRGGCRYENTWADQIRETLSRSSKGSWKNCYDEKGQSCNSKPRRSSFIYL